MKPLTLKKVLLKIRSVGTFWVAKQTLEHLEAIRTYELGIVFSMLPPKGKVLEIGAGTGWQAQCLRNRGYDVSAIDLASSHHRENRICPVIEYDGENIPFDDGTFDIVFSSNTLEHIPHIYEFQKEIHRVLKSDGLVLHVLPSSSWRIWTSIVHPLKRWNLPKAHGELAGNSLTEIYYFSRQWWTQLFRETGWTVVAQESSRLFYTGHLIMGSRLNISMRSKLSRVLGSSCNIFVARKANSPESQ